MFAIFTIPYLLRELGSAGFGVLTLIWALIGYFSLFEFGVGRALTYELARRSPSTPELLAPYMRAGLILTLLTGVIGAVLVALISKSLIYLWLNVEPQLREDALLSFLIAAAGIVPTTASSSMRGALEGIDRFALSNVIRSVTGIMMFALPAWAVYFHGNFLWTATLYLVIARLVIMLLQLYQLRVYIGMKTAMRRSHFSALLNYGAWVTVTGIVGPLMVYGDRFFVSAAVGAALLPQYAIPQEALQRLLVLPTALCGALLPQLAMLSGKNIKLAYRKNSQQVTIGMFFVCFGAAIFAYPAFSIWISRDFALSVMPLTLILIVGIWLNSMAMVPYTVIQAMGKPKITALFHLIELVLYAVLLWLLTRRYGLVGAATAWTARVAIDFFALRVAARKILNA